MYCDFRHHHFQQLPCLRCHPHSYIRMVQHLIERCLLLHLSRDQCIKALAEQASIRPQITLTVWRELQKENKEFFHAYFQSIYPRHLTIRNYIQREARFTRRKHYWSVQLQILMAALVIGGGIANFTDVAATFNGIIRALKEKVFGLEATMTGICKQAIEYITAAA